MPDLMVISGPPGAGKSTVAALLAARMDPSVLVEGDVFFGFLATGGIDPWLPEADRQNQVVTEAAARATSQFVRAGYHTVFDGVVGPWLIDRFLMAARLDAADYVILQPSAAECVRRVGRRIGHAFDDVPATRKMHQEFSAAAVDARHVLENQDDGPEQTVARILQARDAGSLRYRPNPTTGEADPD